MSPGNLMFETASAAMALLDRDVAVWTATLIGRDATTALAIPPAIAAGLIVPETILDLRLRT